MKIVAIQNLKILGGLSLLAGVTGASIVKGLPAKGRENEFIKDSAILTAVTFGAFAILDELKAPSIPVGTSLSMRTVSAGNLIRVDV